MRYTFLVFLICALFQTYANAQTFSTGTGFIISPNGHLATNLHVVQGADRVDIRAWDGTFYEAHLLAVDRANDLAILKVDGQQLSPLAIRASSNVRKGDSVFTLGFPNIHLQGSDVKVTEGIISSLSGITGEPNSFQISVAVQPGNSGGPLLDMSGRVIGIVSSKLSAAAAVQSSGALPENVNYAVKSNYLLELIAAKNDVLHSVSSVQRPQVKQSSLTKLIEHTERAVVLVVSQKAETTTASKSTSSIQGTLNQAIQSLEDAGIQATAIPSGYIEVTSKTYSERWKTTLRVGDKITHCDNIRVFNLEDVRRECFKGGKTNLMFKVVDYSGENIYRSIYKR